MYITRSSLECSLYGRAGLIRLACLRSIYYTLLQLPRAKQTAFRTKDLIKTRSGKKGAFQTLRLITIIISALSNMLPRSLSLSLSLTYKVRSFQIHMHVPTYFDSTHKCVLSVAVYACEIATQDLPYCAIARASPTYIHTYVHTYVSMIYAMRRDAIV